MRIESPIPVRQPQHKLARPPGAVFHKIPLVLQMEQRAQEKINEANNRVKLAEAQVHTAPFVSY